MDNQLTMTRPKRVASIAIPPILARTAAPNSPLSRGHNTENIIDPLGDSQRKYHTSMTAIPYIPRRHMIYDHLRWNYNSDSEFSSWSSSLLWVLVHAVRKLYYKEEPAVLIYILDTTSIPAGRIHRASDLVRDHDLSCWTTVKENADQGEYLIHGKLENTNGMWKAVEFQDLIDAGFWDCFRFESLVDDEGKLVKHLLALRWAWSKRTYALTDWTYTALGALAQCFGPDWEGVVMVALIALRARDLSPPELARMVSILQPMRIPQLPWAESEASRGLHITMSQMEEACQFLQILRLLNDETTAESSGA